MTEKRFSLIIPAYNESDSLPALVERCRHAFDGQPGLEVIIVDNGSTDATPKVLRQLADGTLIRTVRVESNRGYGHGILSGLAEARGEMIGWTHADLQTDPGDAVRALAAAGDVDGAGRRPFVKGERFGRPLIDRLFTLGMAHYEKFLFGYDFRDINGQPTIFSKVFYLSWRDPPWDFSLDLYAYMEAHRQGLEVVRIPVTFPPRRHGQSHWNRGWRDRWKFIRRTIRYSHALKRRTAGVAER